MSHDPPPCVMKPLVGQKSGTYPTPPKVVFYLPVRNDSNRHEVCPPGKTDFKRKHPFKYSRNDEETEGFDDKMILILYFAT